MAPLILIVEDEANLRKTLADIFSARDYRVMEAAGAGQAVDLLRESVPDLVVTDWKMPGGGGEEVLKCLLGDPRGKLTPVIVITAFGSSDVAIEAIRLGAYDFITKPFDLREISLTVERALAHAALSNEVAQLRKQVEAAPPAGRLIGNSQAMLEVFKTIGKVSGADSTVLITGESGTGKQLVAEAIHEYSRRKGKPFIVVNCATLPENLLESELFGHEKGAFTGAASRNVGRFELAEGGTIFLDEIAELPPGLQAKLLQVLQEHSFHRLGGAETIKGDFRVLAATNRDLDTRIREGSFREDLFYRLNVVHISLTPLRDRRSDIAFLAGHFLKAYSEANNVPMVGFSAETLLMLQTYSYPGNVRELENMIERAVIMARGRVLMPEHFPAFTRSEPSGDAAIRPDELLDMPFHRAIGELEKALIEKALREAGGNKSEAANKLQINRRLLYSKMVEHNIEE